MFTHGVEAFLLFKLGDITIAHVLGVAIGWYGVGWARAFAQGYRRATHWRR